MNTETIDLLIDKVIQRIKSEFYIPVEASGRHVHLNRQAVDLLFGKDYQLTYVRDLSQPGQFVCKERVTIVGPKGSISNVVILGPERPENQVEISKTDTRTLGIDAPIRESGDIANTPGVVIVTEKNALHLEKGLIIAKRHIHMTPQDAEKFRVQDKEIVKVRILTDRELIFDDVVVRVSDKYATSMHIDYDEANACGFTEGTLGEIIH